MEIERNFRNCGVYYITIYNHYSHQTHPKLLPITFSYSLTCKDLKHSNLLMKEAKLVPTKESRNMGEY